MQPNGRPIGPQSLNTLEQTLDTLLDAPRGTRRNSTLEPGTAEPRAKNRVTRILDQTLLYPIMPSTTCTEVPDRLS
jgi:hypothetical protein